MSTIAVKKVKLGDSGTPANNFLIEVPAVADGTLTIKREDGTAVLSIAADGRLDLAEGVSAGTYTPVLTGSTTAGVGTYTSQVGEWRKFGDLVFVSATVQWTAHTGTGEMRLSLPFTGAAGASSPLSVWASGLNVGSGFVPAMLAISGQSFGVIYGVSDSGASVALPAMDTSGQIRFSGWYIAE